MTPHAPIPSRQCAEVIHLCSIFDRLGATPFWEFVAQHPLPQPTHDSVLKGQGAQDLQDCLGGEPEWEKEQQGDNKTPEGTYVIDAKNRGSRYHRSPHISYPNGNDKRRAQQLGVSPGGDIMIHGIKNGFSSVGDLHTRVDWTKGCIAVTDKEIEEIDALTPKGATVEIRP